MESVGRRVGSVLSVRPRMAFVLIAFGWAWTWDVGVAALVGPSPGIGSTIPRTWGPLVGVAVVLRARDDSITTFLQAVVTIPDRSWLLVGAVILPIALGEVDAVVALATGTPAISPAQPLLGYVTGFIVVALLAGGLEEFGWRAYLQPTLQAGLSALVAAVSIGVIWATWHLPLFFLFDLATYNPGSLPVFYAVLMAESVVMAWLFNETGGSVLAPMAFHAAANLPPVTRVEGSLPGLLDILGRYGYALAIIGVAVVIVLVRGRNLARWRLPADRWPP